MFKSYFKPVWRGLIKNKTYSAINIVGLAAGMAVGLLIGLWVFYQFSYDRFLPGYEQVYRVQLKYNNNGEINIGQSTPLPLPDALKTEIPEIKYVAQTDYMGAHSLVIGDKKLYERGAVAGSDFLKIFRYPFVKGNAEAALLDPYSIVLTESIAKALFGSEDPINKTLRYDNAHNLNVTGIIKDIPSNSTLQFNYIIPFSYKMLNDNKVKNNLTNWRDKSFKTFIALQPNATYADVAPRLKELMKKYSPDDYQSKKVEAFMQPLKDWHLYPDFKNGVAAGGFIEYIKMFSIIGVLVLLIACINFINLSTARSEKKAKEVGIRKAIGSQRKNLIFQFLIESFVITFFAFLLSLILVQLALPSFNSLTKTNLSIPYTNIIFWCIMIGFVLITSLLAGSRPAFYFSSFRPVKVLKGAIQMGRAAAIPRKALVVVQFTCSIALIICTIIVYQQIQYAKERPKGYDAARLIMSDASEDLKRNYLPLKNEMLRSGVVTSVTKSNSPVTEIWSDSRIDDWSGKLPNESLGLSSIGVSDADYFRTMGMQMKEGRNFIGNTGADSLSVILNESAVKRMRFKEPLNQFITWRQSKQKVKVVGVVKDALMSSPFSPASPTIFIYDPSWSNIITYRLSPTVSTQKAITTIEKIFNNYNPSYPFMYKFVDESYSTKFDFEVLIGKLAGLFSILTILISCIGLFGLAAYMAEQRTKEIGIRKLLGASVARVWLLLSKEFIVLVVFSCILASPLAFYYLNDWLQEYPYRIKISPVVFVLAGVAAMGITIITISFQAIKAAIANPVKSLRTQ